jgi:hypothetical protein
MLLLHHPKDITATQPGIQYLQPPLHLNQTQAQTHLSLLTSPGLHHHQQSPLPHLVTSALTPHAQSHSTVAMNASVTRTACISIFRELISVLLLDVLRVRGRDIVALIK